MMDREALSPKLPSVKSEKLTKKSPKLKRIHHLHIGFFQAAICTRVPSVSGRILRSRQNRRVSQRWTHRLWRLSRKIAIWACSTRELENLTNRMSLWMERRAHQRRLSDRPSRLIHWQSKDSHLVHHRIISHLTIRGISTYATRWT